ncbi:MAG: hypothetical protein KBE09_04730 [Candidatus Pacebacteria bacterium]|nr:hypothetical protein [Candidatus Paceibacterota bacterium]
MAKTTIKLANGTVITVEGSTEEVAHVLSLYGEQASFSGASDRGATAKKAKKTGGTKSIETDEKEGKIDVLTLVNATKDADDFEQIEKKILDNASQVDRVLLPLFITERDFGATAMLTSNDIYKFLKEFGINMALPNVSKTLSSSAIKYVMASSTRKKGTSTSYRISRKGKQYVEQMLKN